MAVTVVVSVTLEAFRNGRTSSVGGEPNGGLHGGPFLSAGASRVLTSHDGRGEYRSWYLLSIPRRMGGVPTMHHLTLPATNCWTKSIISSCHAREQGTGPGGQKINKVRNCVQLTHKPTGVMVSCQEARELSSNRSIARKRLQDKVRAMTGASFPSPPLFSCSSTTHPWRTSQVAGKCCVHCLR